MGEDPLRLVGEPAVTLHPRPGSNSIKVARAAHGVIAGWAALVAGLSLTSPLWSSPALRWGLAALCIVPSLLAVLRPTAEVFRWAAAAACGFAMIRAASVAGASDLSPVSRAVASGTYLLVAVLALTVGVLTASVAGMRRVWPEHGGEGEAVG